MNATWIRCEDRLPDVDVDRGLWSESVPVLATNGSHARVAYVEVWRADGVDDPPSPRWKMAGRDGYGFHGVTHWMPLPEMPSP